MSSKLILNKINVANYLTLGNIVIKDTESLARQINEVLHKSGVINARVKRALAEKLKIATGELIDTIDFSVELDKKNSDTLSVSITSNGHSSKLNALLGEAELNAHSSSLKQPDISIESIADYIRSKRSIFNVMIRGMKDNRIERLAFQTQRRNEIINRTKYDTKKLRASAKTQRQKYILGQRNMEKFDDESIILDYAETIRGRMDDRVESGLSYTYGSSRSLLGFRKESKRNGITPIYRKNATPLLTLDSNDGIINQIYSSYITSAIHGMMKHAGFLVSSGKSSGSLNSDLNNYFDSIKASVTTKGKQYYDIMGIVEDVNNLISEIERSKKVNISKLYNVNTPYAQNIAAQIDSVHDRIYSMYKSSSLQSFSLAKKDVDRMLKQIDSDTRKLVSKRRAIRIKG